MTERRRYCPRRHDTFAVGRDSSHRCLACKRESMAAARAARAAEARAAESARYKAELDRMVKARERERRRILAAGGEAALELKQLEAHESERCGWELSETEVCMRPAAGPWGVWCRMHCRQLEREQARRKAALSPDGSH